MTTGDTSDGPGERAQHAVKVTLAVLTCLVAVAANVWWIREVLSHNDHDFAGYGPRKVARHGMFALQHWYGQNDMPANLELVAKSHSELYGQDAWQVVYRAPSGAYVCAYVMKGRANEEATSSTDIYTVVRGRECYGS